MNLDNKTILITGGTGSLGRALLRRLKHSLKTRIIIYSRDETKQGKLKEQYPQHTYILGDITNAKTLTRAMRGVDVVFHFAAYKQVPAAQNNVITALETNILGSLNVADSALESGVSQVVAASTDKAAYPANFYGVTKAAMESIFQHYNGLAAQTTFHLARYGNVVCSNASVIPLFRKWAASGDPIRVTNRQMTRFWISLDTALDLIFKALTCDPGVIVVPKAPAMAMWDLAKLLSNGNPVIETAIRPGEKIHECMVTEAESFHTLQDDHYFYIHPSTSSVYNPEAPFSYTSDRAKTISDRDILEIIHDYEAVQSD